MKPIIELQANNIIQIVSDHFRVDCMEHSRKREIVYARQIAMYLINKLVKISLTKNGNMFNRNHATVMHSIKLVKYTMESNTSFYKEDRSIIKKLEKKSIKMIRKVVNEDKAKRDLEHQRALRTSKLKQEVVEMIMSLKINELSILRESLIKKVA